MVVWQFLVAAPAVGILWIADKKGKQVLDSLLSIFLHDQEHKAAVEKWGEQVAMALQNGIDLTADSYQGQVAWCFNGQLEQPKDFTAFGKGGQGSVFEATINVGGKDVEVSSCVCSVHQGAAAGLGLTCRN